MRLPGKNSAALCACNLVIYAGISGLVGLMPLYLARFGAGAAGSGLFLAFAYACLAASNVGGGWILRRVPRPKALLVGGGALAAPLAGAVGHAASFGAAMAAMGCLWFAAGLAMTMVVTLTGTGAERGRRGRRFGALSLSQGVGLLAGSLVSGWVVDRWGFSALFGLFAAAYLVVPLAGLAVDDGAFSPTAKAAPAARGPLPGWSFLALVTAIVLAHASNIMLFLSRALLMQGRGYDATAISTAAAVGSLATLPLPALLGWLADRCRRTPLMVACFAAPALGLLVQRAADGLWAFWMASVLGSVLGASLVVAAAAVTDAAPPGALGARLGMLNATPWLGIVLGLTGGGAAMGALGVEAALGLGLLPGLAGMALLLAQPLGRSGPSAVSAPPPAPSAAAGGCRACRGHLLLGHPRVGSRSRRLRPAE